MLGQASLQCKHMVMIKDRQTFPFLYTYFHSLMKVMKQPNAVVMTFMQATRLSMAYT